MEGDPLLEGGLEYLFGVVSQDGGKPRYKAIWGHDREAEGKAFEAAVDFMGAQLAECPDTHIYHYGAYEQTALKRLAMYHGTREAEVDNFLRRGALVNLYQVVREAMRVSEPSYSLKNLEALYMDDARGGQVTTAGGSIVTYERWRRLGDGTLLKEIARYNELDCRSALSCRDWLLSLRPGAASWFTGPAGLAGKSGDDEKRREADARTAELTAALLRTVPPAEREWRELLTACWSFTSARRSRPGGRRYAPGDERGRAD